MPSSKEITSFIKKKFGDDPSQNLKFERTWINEIDKTSRIWYAAEALVLAIESLVSPEQFNQTTSDFIRTTKEFLDKTRSTWAIMRNLNNISEIQDIVSQLPYQLINSLSDIINHQDIDLSVKNELLLHSYILLCGIQITLEYKLPDGSPHPNKNEDKTKFGITICAAKNKADKYNDVEELIGNLLALQINCHRPQITVAENQEMTTSVSLNQSVKELLSSTVSAYQSYASQQIVTTQSLRVTKKSLSSESASEDDLLFKSVCGTDEEFIEKYVLPVSDDLQASEQNTGWLGNIPKIGLADIQNFFQQAPEALAKLMFGEQERTDESNNWVTQEDLDLSEVVVSSMPPTADDLPLDTLESLLKVPATTLSTSKVPEPPRKSSPAATTSLKYLLDSVHRNRVKEEVDNLKRKSSFFTGPPDTDYQKFLSDDLLADSRSLNIIGMAVIQGKGFIKDIKLAQRCFETALLLTDVIDDNFVKLRKNYELTFSEKEPEKMDHPKNAELSTKLYKLRAEYIEKAERHPEYYFKLGYVEYAKAIALKSDHPDEFQCLIPKIISLFKQYYKESETNENQLADPTKSVFHPKIVGALENLLPDIKQMLSKSDIKWLAEKVGITVELDNSKEQTSGFNLKS